MTETATDVGRTEFWPTTSSGDFRRWDLPASAWSCAESYEDSIKVCRQGAKWWASTERDQCVHRDLDANEIESIRNEFCLAGAA